MISLVASTLAPGGPIAEAMADLWWLMLALGVGVFLLFAALLIASLIRSAPEASSDEEREPRLVRRWIGVGGVAMPAVIIIVVFAATLVAMRDVPVDAPDGALHVEITGHQFWYEVRYLDEQVVTANELHVPVGRPIAIRLLSDDVIHSFWVPALGGKLDMIPERVNTLVLQADDPGEHDSRCAEFCGLQHAKMGMVVVAESPQEFESWLASHREAEPTTDLQRAGQEVFTSAGCVQCHAVRGAQEGGATAPDLTDLPTRRTIAAGSLPNTREHLAQWIRDPQRFKPGVDMPASDLSDEDLDALLAYLRGEG